MSSTTTDPNESVEPYEVNVCPQCGHPSIRDRRRLASATPTIECPRCGYRTPPRRAKTIDKTDDLNVARELRSRWLAAEWGHADEYEDLGPVSELKTQADDYLDRRFATASEAATTPIGSDRFADHPGLDRMIGEDRFATLAEHRLDEWRARFGGGQSAERTGGRSPPDDIDAPDDAGVNRLEPGDQTPADAIRISGVGPRRSEWLSEVLKALLPTQLHALKEHGPKIDDRAAATAAWALLEGTLGVPLEAGDQTAWRDTEAEIAAYAQHVVGLAADAADLTAVDELPDDSVDLITSIGTGRGPANAGLAALAQGPMRILQALVDDAPTLQLHLDGSAWTDLEDRRTGVRALAAIATLGMACDVQLVISPSLDQHLEHRYPRWYRAHLTELRDRSCNDQTEADPDDHLVETAWAAIRTFPEQSAKIRLLANIGTDSPREYRDLVADSEIDASRGTIDRYIRELEDENLLTVDRTGRYNTVQLTPAGRVAVREFIAPDYTLTSPSQTTLETSLTPAPQPATSNSVAREASTGRGEGAAADSAEEWLQQTDPAPDAGYIQWLGPVTDRLDAYAQHKRLTAASRGGVTLVDDRIQHFEDGRVAYISAFEDEFLTVVQWGGPLSTLGRIAGSLLSPQALNKVLTPSALGDDLGAIFEGGLVEDLDQTIHAILRRGLQTGWLSEDEETYDGWRDRYEIVRSLCLEQVAKLANSDDREARGELFKDLHGLIASTTQLYRGAGVEVHINLRLPDTTQLVAGEDRLQDFLDFLRYTVPKQSRYGVHSGPRTLLEDRPEKLKSRLPYAVDETDPAMNLTAQWLITGPAVTDLQSSIKRAFERAADDVREDIQEGEVEAPWLEIPVRLGDSYRAIKDLVAEFADVKGYEVAEADAPVQEAADIDRLTRFLLQATHTADRPHRGDPHAVVESMLAIARSTKPLDPLTIEDLEYGLAQLAPDRLLPELPPSATKVIQVLLEADGPIGRSEILNRAGISGSSYDRYIGELAALDILEPRQVEGRRGWTASLAPWWTPTSRRDDPPAPIEPDDDYRYGPGTPTQKGVLSQAALRLAKYYDNDDLLDAWRSTNWPLDDIERFTTGSDRFARWREFIWLAFAPQEAIVEGTPPDLTTNHEERVIQLGPPRPAAPGEQATIEANGGGGRVVGS